MQETAPDPRIEVDIVGLSPAAREWLEASASRLVASPRSALEAAARPLIIERGRRWGARLDPEAPGWDSYRRRVVGTLAYHWWRYAERGFRPLDEVVGLIAAGRLAYGRCDGDVVEDVVLAEGYLQHEPGAAGRFVSVYRPFLLAEARRCGGARAEQELQGLEADLILPRENRPPRLALYAGHTPMRDWLRQVVRHAWVNVLRRARRERPEIEDAAGDDAPPERSAEGRDCVELLRPLLTGAVAAIGREEALLVRMAVLDDVPQVQIARLHGVHKSTITRRLQRASGAILDRFRELARGSGRGADLDDCLRWMLSERGEAMRVTAGDLARLLPPPDG